MKRRKLSPEIIILILLSMLCILLPSDANTSMDSNWLANVTGLNFFWMFYIRLYLVKPLWWGVLSFFLLRSGILRLDFLTQLLTKKVCIVIRVMTIVLLLVLIYLTVGFVFYFAPLPPVPFKIGLYIMNHHQVLEIGWFLAAILVYLSFGKCSKSGQEEQQKLTE